MVHPSPRNTKWFAHWKKKEKKKNLRRNLFFIIQVPHTSCTSRLGINQFKTPLGDRRCTASQSPPSLLSVPKMTAVATSLKAGHAPFDPHRWMTFMTSLAPCPYTQLPVITIRLIIEFTRMFSSLKILFFSFSFLSGAQQTRGVYKLPRERENKKHFLENDRPFPLWVEPCN